MNSLPNFILPIGQTDIEITFEEYQNLISFNDNGGGGDYNPPVVSECYLHMNHIFLLPEISRIFQTRYGVQMIRVHRFHMETLDKESGSIKLHQLKWPIESIYIGFRPQSNLLNSQNWYKNAQLTLVEVAEPVIVGSSTPEVNVATFYEEQQVTSSIGLKSHDITIYPDMPPEFYNNYLPYRWGDAFKTPDVGWLMMNFNINPGDQQPSGHLNVSRSRELYLNYLSAVNTNNNYIIRKTNPVDLIVLADCINFLIFQNNSINLRFAT